MQDQDTKVCTQKKNKNTILQLVGTEITQLFRLHVKRTAVYRHIIKWVV